MLTSSPAFAREKAALDTFKAGNQGFVYAISRFDDDDSTICTFSTTSYSANAPLTGIGGLEPVTLASGKATRKVQPTDVVRTNYDDLGTPIPASQTLIAASGQGGGHAEELFIRKLPKMFSEFGAPKKIDLFVSRIPCADQSSYWVFQGPNGDVLMPQGCANKLRVIMEHLDSVTWRIWWDEAYSKAPTQLKCVHAMDRMAGRAIVGRYRG